ncbi:MAG: nickel pincer cofactor biosynthesis protein LarC [Synergistaceae bacterium]|nr:nickel pincer cofactor biosynthesis protein LarC [Synergistaceae bacterium]
MRTIYIDAQAGVAGDMMVAALFSLLASAVGDETAERKFRDELAKIPLLGYRIEFKNEIRGGIFGRAFSVYDECSHLSGESHGNVHRNFHDIEKIFLNSSLDMRVIRECIHAFAVLAEAEAKVHGTTVDKVHFHEVGAVDSIIDIAGTFILMDQLKWPRVISSNINVGSGTVKCAHGILPVPAPATLELIKGLPVFSMGEEMERATPTGALLIKLLSSAFSPMPRGKVVFAGYGVGKKESGDIPNALRAVIMESQEDSSRDNDFCVIIETNIDDMSPQDYLPVMDKLFECGALDVWMEPIYMKKNRPAEKLCCITRPENKDSAVDIILRHTTTQGVRHHIVSRDKLFWRIEEINTPLGTVRMKISKLGDKVLRVTPEHDDLKRISARNDMTLNEVRATVADYYKGE